MFDLIRNFTKSAEEKRQERLNAYLDGALSAHEQRRFEQELDRDADLRADLEQLRWVKLSVQELPRVRAPRNFVLDPAVYGQKKPAPPNWNLYPGLRVATALTAFFLVLTLALDAVTPYGALDQPFGGMSEPQSVAEEASDTFATTEMENAAEAPAEEVAEGDGAAEMIPFAVTGEAEAALAVEEAEEEAVEDETQDEAARQEEAVEEPQAEEELAEEPAADRLTEEPAPEGTPLPGAAAPAENGEDTAAATAAGETAAMPAPEATLQTEAEPAPLIIVTEAPPEVSAAESADGDTTVARPASFPFLLAIEIVLALTLVILIATMALIRRMT